MNDLLEEEDLTAVTGVDPKARLRNKKIIDVLEKANIYYWLKHDGSVATTWTHIHRSGVAANDKLNPSPETPKFEAIR